MPTLQQRRVGTDEPEPEIVPLHAGALSAWFVAGALRNIRYNGVEVLRSIAYLVRDKDWGTYTPVMRDCSIDMTDTGFAIAYDAECLDAESGDRLTYTARITADTQGHLHFDVTAHPHTDFTVTRCGFAILHPLRGVAGEPALVEHVDGSIEDGRFPALIAPYQPFKNIRAITHTVATGITATCRMNGDTFEMEDQRNWSDASFKTYVRPLELPWPYVMKRGVSNRQSIALQITGTLHTAASAHKPGCAVELSISQPDGLIPGIGILIAPEESATVLEHVALVRDLHPQHLLFHFDPARHDPQAFADFAAIAAISRAASTLEVPLPCKDGVHEELARLAEQMHEVGFQPESLLLSPAVDRQSTPPGSLWPECPPLAEIYTAAREIFPGMRLGGGMLSYFTELNRKRPPVDLLDFVSHCTCPIVHAADDLSVMQSLEAIPYITRSTRAFIGDAIEYRIGPATIGMRHNPYGSRIMENPGNRRIPMAMHDPRQSGLFAAAWMLGYLAATQEAHLSMLTVGALTGPLGLAASNGTRRTAFFAAQALATIAGHTRLRCTLSHPETIAAVATEHDGRRTLWLANLTAEIQPVHIVDATVRTMEILDEMSFSAFRSERPAGDLSLRPYAIARIELKA